MANNQERQSFDEKLVGWALELDKIEVSDAAQDVAEQHSNLIATALLTARLEMESGFYEQAWKTITYFAKQMIQVGYTAGVNSVLYGDSHEN